MSLINVKGVRKLFVGKSYEMDKEESAKYAASLMGAKIEGYMPVRNKKVMVIGDNRQSFVTFVNNINSYFDDETNDMAKRVKGSKKDSIKEEQLHVFKAYASVTDKKQDFEKVVRDNKLDVVFIGEKSMLMEDNSRYSTLSLKASLDRVAREYKCAVIYNK